jgi:hypothetical protein
MRAPLDPSPSDYNTALREIAEHIQASEREILEELEGETEDGRREEGYIVSHGDHRVSISGIQGSQHFRIQMGGNVVENAAFAFAVQDHSDGGDIEMSEIEDLEVVDSHMERGEEFINAIIENTQDKKLIDVGLNVRDILTTPHTQYQVNNHGLAVIGYSHIRKFHVYDDRVGSRELDQAIQSVVGPATIAESTLNKAYNLQDISDQAVSETAPEPSTDRRYQY